MRRILPVLPVVFALGCGSEGPTTGGGGTEYPELHLVVTDGSAPAADAEVDIYLGALDPVSRAPSTPAAPIATLRTDAKGRFGAPQGVGACFAWIRGASGRTGALVPLDSSVRGIRLDSTVQVRVRFASSAPAHVRLAGTPFVAVTTDSVATWSRIPRGWYRVSTGTGDSPTLVGSLFEARKDTSFALEPSQLHHPPGDSLRLWTFEPSANVNSLAGVAWPLDSTRWGAHDGLHVVQQPRGWCLRIDPGEPVRFHLGAPDSAYDLGGMDAIAFWARGPGRVELALATTAHSGTIATLQAGWDLDSTWRRVVVPPSLLRAPAGDATTWTGIAPFLSSLTLRAAGTVHIDDIEILGIPAVRFQTR